MSYCFGRKHHIPLTISPSMRPLFFRSKSLFFTYSALPSNSLATSEDGIAARLRHSVNAFINFSSVYFESVIRYLQRIKTSFYIYVIVYSRCGIYDAREPLNIISYIYDMVVKFVDYDNFVCPLNIYGMVR